PDRTVKKEVPCLLVGAVAGQLRQERLNAVPPGWYDARDWQRGVADKGQQGRQGMHAAAGNDRPRNLVTGVTGFAGCFLAEALLERGDIVVGLSRRATWPDDWAHLRQRVELFACDLCDGPAVEALLRHVRP